MPEYEWRNMRTGEIVTTNSPNQRPGGEEWQRVYNFGIGSVSGAGGSPSRPPTKSN